MGYFLVKMCNVHWLPERSAVLGSAPCASRIFTTLIECSAIEILMDGWLDFAAILGPSVCIQSKLRLPHIQLAAAAERPSLW